MASPPYFFTERYEISSWLDDHHILNYTIHEDLSVDVEGDVGLFEQRLSFIPVRFNRVEGYFDCSSNFLTTLSFAPRYVKTGFDCSRNRLKNLEFCPDIIEGHLNCSSNLLKNLEFIPSVCVLGFFCMLNPGLGAAQRTNHFEEIKKLHSIFLIAQERARLERDTPLIEISANNENSDNASNFKI